MARHHGTCGPWPSPTLNRPDERRQADTAPLHSACLRRLPIYRAASMGASAPPSVRHSGAPVVHGGVEVCMSQIVLPWPELADQNIPDAGAAPPATADQTGTDLPKTSRISSLLPCAIGWQDRALCMCQQPPGLSLPRSSEVIRSGWLSACCPGIRTTASCYPAHKETPARHDQPSDFQALCHSGTGVAEGIRIGAIH